MLCLNPCACHAKSTLNLKKWSETLVFQRFCHRNRSRATAGWKFCGRKLQKVPRTPNLPVFKDVDFRIALAPQQGANFAHFASFEGLWLPNRSRATAWCKVCGLQLQEVVRTFQFLTILTSKSLSRHSGVRILATSLAADPPHSPVSRSWLAEPAKPQNYGKTQHFAQFLPAKTSSSHTSQLYHICAITSLGCQIFSGNSQYSRMLDSETSFDNYHNDNGNKQQATRNKQ